VESDGSLYLKSVIGKKVQDYKSMLWYWNSVLERLYQNVGSLKARWQGTLILVGNFSLQRLCWLFRRAPASGCLLFAIVLTGEKGGGNFFVHFLKSIVGPNVADSAVPHFNGSPPFHCILRR